MSGFVRAWSLVVLGGGLGLIGVRGGQTAHAADGASFEDAAREAAQAPELDALVAPYLDDCAKARREIDRARCRGMQDFVRDKIAHRLYSTVIDSPNVVSVSSYDAAIKGFRIKLVGCLTCEKPLLGPAGQKRFVTLKVPDRHASSFGAASILADSTVSFDSLPEARAWETKIKPQLRAEFVFRPSPKSWSYKDHKGVAFAPVATRVFNRCTGEVLYSSPRSTAKVPVEEDVDGCKPGAPAAAAAAAPAAEPASKGEKEGARAGRQAGRAVPASATAPAVAAAQEAADSGGRNKENLDGRPDKLGATEISHALRVANQPMRDCDVKHRQRGSVDLEFEVPGSGGPAQVVRAKGQLGGTEVAKCLLDAVRKVKFPEFQRASQTFSFSVRLQGE
jgi:hypothetical protein